MFCRQVGLVQLAVVGGQLDTALLDRDQQGGAESREEEQQLRVFILDNRGHLFLWQDTATQQLTRCAYLNLQLSLMQNTPEFFVMCCT